MANGSDDALCVMDRTIIGTLFYDGDPEGTGALPSILVHNKGIVSNGNTDCFFV